MALAPPTKEPISIGYGTSKLTCNDQSTSVQGMGAFLD